MQAVNGIIGLLVTCSRLSICSEDICDISRLFLGDTSVLLASLPSAFTVNTTNRLDCKIGEDDRWQ